MRRASGGIRTPNLPGLSRLPLLFGPRWRVCVRRPSGLGTGAGREDRTLLFLRVRQVSSPDERAPRVGPAALRAVGRGAPRTSVTFVGSGGGTCTPTPAVQSRGSF